MRLLYVSHSFPPPARPLSNLGGMQRLATELHDALRDHPEVELFPLVLRTSWRGTFLRFLPFLLGLLWRIPAVVRREGIEVVLFSSMGSALLAVPLRRRMENAGTRLVAIATGLDVTLPFGPYQRYLPRVFEALDGVVAISRATGAECIRRGLRPERLQVVPCGVDPRRFPPPGDRTAARRALLEQLGDPAHPLPDGALLLCSVGRQVRRKGFAWFIEQVMPRLPAEVHYWLAGDGPQRAAIRRAITRGGLEGRVRLLGRVSEADLLRLYRGADLFVMPNVPVPGDMEGFGIVMLEAGLCGLPTIAARLEGIPDVVREGVNGHLVTSGDADAFAEAILRYHQRRDDIAAASARAREYVRRTFSWSVVADRYARVVRSAGRFAAAGEAPPPPTPPPNSGEGRGVRGAHWSAAPEPVPASEQSPLMLHATREPDDTRLRERGLGGEGQEGGARS